MKMKTIQRAFAWALTLVMVLSAAPLGVFAEGEEEQVCSCTVKCGETAKEDCPVCGGESGNPAACVGKTQEELEAEAKLAAEEAERKAAEEAAQKAAEEAERKAAEEAAQKAAEEAERKAAEEAAQKAAEEGGNPPAKVESKKSEDTTGDNMDSAADDDNDTVEMVEVKFDTNEAEEVFIPMSVAKGGTLGGKLPTPHKSRHTFEGWYKDQAFKGDKVTGETPFDVNTTLYAKWTATDPTPDTGNQVTVTFDANGGTVNPSSMTVEKGDTLSGRLPTPGRDGYTFEGWYKNKDCTGDKVIDGTPFGEETILYAKWTENKTVSPVTVTFNANGGTVEPSSRTVGEDGTISLPTPTKTGFTFDGWYVSETFDGAPVNESDTYSADTILYAKWTEVTVTFDFQIQGVDPQKKTTIEGKLSEEFPTVDNPGYLLEGWYRNPDCSGDKVTKEGPFTEPTTLYAKWTAKPGYTVTFDFNGAESSVNPYTTDNFGKLSNLPEPKRNGCNFLGWYIGGTKVDVNHIYTENTTLVAKWSRDVHSIEVAIKGPGISAPEGFLNDIEIDPGVARIEVVAAPQENEALKEALKRQIRDLDKKHVLQFDLSVETQDVDGTKIGNLHRVRKPICFTFENVPGDDIQVFRLHGGALEELHPSDGNAEGYGYSDGTLTIFANQFSPYAIISNTVAVKIDFDPMGGTVNPKTMTTGTDGKLKENLPTPTRTGYTFDGWYFDKKYTGNKIAQGETFLRDCTVYAKWNPNTYTVTFHDNYNDPEVKSQQTFTYDVAQSLDCGSTIRRDYYTLSGWAETSGGPKKFAPTETVQSLIPSGNKDLYALWTYAPRRVTFDADGGKIKKDGAEVDKVTVNTQEAPINTVKAADVPVPELREGYYFGGWYTRKDGKGDLVKTGETKEPTVFTADATVYAYWVEFEPVTVTFKCQGGTVRIGSTDVKEFTMQTKWPGVLDGTPSTPARSGYKFEGWYTAAGVKVDADTLFLRNSTVYAHWRRAVSSTGNPRTGDQAKLEAAIAILAAAAIGLGATVVLKKRKEK